MPERRLYHAWARGRQGEPAAGRKPQELPRRSGFNETTRKRTAAIATGFPATTGRRRRPAQGRRRAARAHAAGVGEQAGERRTRRRRPAAGRRNGDRKSDVQGERVTVRVELGGRRLTRTKNNQQRSP